jgi:hypothetical protein
MLPQAAAAARAWQQHVLKLRRVQVIENANRTPVSLLKYGA